MGIIIKKCFVLALLLASLSGFFGCRGNRPEAIEVFRTAPLLSEAENPVFEKLYSIDVTEISLFNKDGNFKRFVDFSAKGKMFIADSFKSKIYIYNNRGLLESVFGGAGQGPAEFSSINRILVDGDKLRVFHSFSMVKNLTHEGEYLSQAPALIENPLYYKIAGNKYYVLRGKLDQDFAKLDLIVSVYDDSLRQGRDLYTYHYPREFGSSFVFRFSDWVLVTDQAEIYFPESILDKYAILHLDADGKLIKTFGRSFTVAGYSREAVDRFHRIYKTTIEKDMRKLPSNPPVVHSMFQDLRGNVWVVVGETTEDNENPDFENTVDIFNRKGEWLYSLKTNVISKYSLFHDGKIYHYREMEEEPFKQFIDVYEIRYQK